MTTKQELFWRDRAAIRRDEPLSAREFPFRLQQLRGTRDIPSFARRIGFSERTLRSLEDWRRARASFSVVQQIANATGCDFEWLMTGRGRPPFEAVRARRSASKDAPVRILSKDDRFKRLRSFLRRRGLNFPEVGLIITRRTKRFCSRQHVRMVVTGRRSTPWVQQALARLIGRDGPDLFGEWWWQERDRRRRP
ncbi:MAG: hypothetical protein J7M19_06150 [Planctomycetes bacterium]|nr:hypothetical protein [Planctomycetota bacterium]